MSNFQKLIDIMARLRGPNGCPWDREQTPQTLKPYLVEETYEVLDALDDDDDDEIVEELGDLLLQIVFHAQIASEENRFTIEDVAEAISEKLIRRHPHIFGDVEANDADQVVKNWQAIKTREKAQKGKPEGALDGVPRQLPALLRAQRIQEKASRVGFDWDATDPVMDKVQEEMNEFLEDYRNSRRDKMKEEFGDLLFALVNLGRFLDINPEEALQQTVEKFRTRFAYIESELGKIGKKPEGATLEEMDALWDIAKTIDQAHRS